MPGIALVNLRQVKRRCCRTCVRPSVHLLCYKCTDKGVLISFGNHFLICCIFCVLLLVLTYIDIRQNIVKYAAHHARAHKSALTVLMLHCFVASNCLHKELRRLYSASRRVQKL